METSYVVRSLLGTLLCLQLTEVKCALHCVLLLSGEDSRNKPTQTHLQLLLPQTWVKRTVPVSLQLLILCKTRKILFSSFREWLGR